MLNAARVILAALVVLLFASGAFAQRTVYKWVDKDGVVQFSDEKPSPSEAVSVEELTVAASLTVSPPEQPPVKEPAEPRKDGEEQAADLAGPATSASPDIETVSLSLEELERRCEAEREAKIAPLRQAEIEKCITEQHKDPAYCNRFYADYGAAGRTIHGTFLPRMFHDLPVCLEAEQKRHGN